MLAMKKMDFFFSIQSIYLFTRELFWECKVLDMNPLPLGENGR